LIFRHLPKREKIMPFRLRLPTMNAPLRTSGTQDQFFAWNGHQEGRYEFDGFQPVAMTGGALNHTIITQNVQAALRARLRGSGCPPLRSDAGVATVGDAVRYPDALVTCSRFAGTARIAPDVIAVFDVIRPTSGRTDRIVKVREYAAVPSIRRHVIVESTTAGITVLERTGADQPWTASTLTDDGILRMSEINIEVPVAEFYEDVDLGGSSEVSGTAVNSPPPGRTGYWPFFSPMPANFLLNLATWPPVSIMRWIPVQAGCDFGSISRRMVSPALP
jgi:hypothetical protein